MGQVAETLERVSACLAPGGRMLFMKGPECDPEIAEAGDFRRACSGLPQIMPIPSRARPTIGGSGLRTAGSPGPAAAPWPATGPELRRTRREVSSESNPSFRLFRDLLGGRGIRKHVEALIAGGRIVGEVLARSPRERPGTDLRRERTRTPERIAPLVSTGHSALRGPRRGGDQFAAAPDSRRPDAGVVGRHALARWLYALYPVPGPRERGGGDSLGRGFRRGPGGAAQGGCPPLPSAKQPGRGSTLFQVPLYQGPSIRQTTSRTTPIIALHTAGPELGEAPFPPRFGLVRGSGRARPTRNLPQGPRRRIAIQPTVELLNAAASAAIALYAWSRQSQIDRE